MKKTLRHLLLINLFIITNVACFSYNAPADASVLSFFGLFRKFTTWSKRQKEGFKVGDVTVAVDVTVDDLTIPVGKVLYAIDPSTARMFDGRVTINYDSSVLTLEKYGWFGDWGADPTLPFPPIDSGSSGSPWYLQTEANPALNQSVTISGDIIKTIEFNYDWGSEGYIPPTTGHFNFFGLEFDKTRPDITTAEIDAAFILPENVLSNFEAGNKVASLANYNRCIPVNSQDEKIVLCGEPIPEPTSTLSLLALGTLGAASTLKRKLKSSKSSEKETTKVG